MDNNSTGEWWGAVESFTHRTMNFNVTHFGGTNIHVFMPSGFGRPRPKPKSWFWLIDAGSAIRHIADSCGKLYATQ